MALTKDLTLAGGLFAVMGLAAIVANIDDEGGQHQSVSAAPLQSTQGSESTQPAITPDDMPYSPHEYRDDLAEMLTLLRIQHPACARQIDPSTARLADLVNPDPVNPEFLVRCNGGRTTVRFTWMDMMNRRLPAPAPIVDRTAAVSACEHAARARAAHPQTVSFSRVMDMEFRDNGDGSASIRTSFKAKNAFNLETKYRIDCEFDGSRIVTVSVSEFQ